MEWLRPLIIIIVSVAIGIILRIFLEGFALKLAKKTTFKFDDIIIRVISNAIIPVCILIGIHFSIMFFPIAINEKLLKIITSIIAFSLIVIIFWNIAYGLSILVEDYINSISQELPTSIFKHLTKFILVLIGILTALHTIGISITPLITTLGIAGLAVALALQDTLANLFAGIHIILSKQIRKGNYIRLENGSEGFVEDITWRNTTLITIENNRIIVPNTKIASSIIINHDLPQKDLSIVVPVGVDYSSDLEKVEKITLEVAREVQREVEGAKRDFEPIIRYREFGESSINFIVVLRAEDFTKQGLIRHEFIKRLKKRYDEEGIIIPFPQRDIWIRGKKF